MFVRCPACGADTAHRPDCALVRDARMLMDTPPTCAHCGVVHDVGVECKQLVTHGSS